MDCAINPRMSAALKASPPRHFSSRILSITDECANVKTFRLEVPEDFSFIAGMWVMINLPGKPKPSRAYSMSSSPFQKGSIEISLSHVGEFTSHLFELKEGDLLELKGPYGKWVYRDDARHAVLISGGTGLTPFRAMARYLLASGLPNKITILYSAKTPQDILYRSDLAALRCAGLRVYTTITRPQGQSWNGPTGRLDTDVVKSQVPDWLSAHYYLCGPISLVEDFTKALEGQGVTRAQIHYEKWGDY